MDITVIGIGNMGRAISRRLACGGADVLLVGKDLEAARRVAAEAAATPEDCVGVDELREALAGTAGSIRAADLADGLAEDVVVLALWHQQALDFARANAAALRGKVVVDIANPLNPTYDGLVTPPGSSAAEELARLVPGAKVVKAFNTTFAPTLTAGAVAGQPLDVFVAGDDGEAKATVARLIEAGGLRAIDVGPLEQARQLEGLGLLHIALQATLGTGFASAVKIIS
jgi:8-hydroxy-5-deazaflavin:NADPH oxidoreductase